MTSGQFHGVERSVAGDDDEGLPSLFGFVECDEVAEAGFGAPILVDARNSAVRLTLGRYGSEQSRPSVNL